MPALFGVGSRVRARVDAASQLFFLWFRRCSTDGLHSECVGFRAGSLPVCRKFAAGSCLAQGWLKLGSCLVHCWFICGSLLVRWWFIGGSPLLRYFCSPCFVIASVIMCCLVSFDFTLDSVSLLQVFCWFVLGSGLVRAWSDAGS